MGWVGQGGDRSKVSRVRRRAGATTAVSLTAIIMGAFLEEVKGRKEVK
jgi:hypothetical protein